MGKRRNLLYMQDLGNIKNKDGEKVLTGKLYRSSCLGKLKDKSLKKIENQYEIKQVIDLRSDDELNHTPEQLDASIDYYHLPPLSDFDNPVINRHNAIQILKKLTKQEGGAKAHLERIYRKLISSEQAIESYREMLRKIINNPDKTTIWHCTQGKDRTGIGSAIILLTLGVDKKEVIEDYLKYNRSCRLKNILIFIGVSIVMFSVKTAKNLNYLLSAQKSYIESAFSEIEELFGSTDNYLHNALQLSNDDIQILKDNFLEQVK